MKKNKVAQILKEEMEYARNTRTAAIKHAQLKREHKDFDSQVVLRILEEAKGYRIDPELLNEGFWDSAKAFMAKFQGKRLAGKETGDFGAAKMKAIDKESQKIISQFVDQLPDGWPNVKTTKEFLDGLTKLTGANLAIRKAAGEEGNTPTIPVDVAESLLGALRDIVSDYESELSYVYRYTNEEEENDGEVLEEDVKSLLTPSNLGRMLRYSKKGWNALRPRQQDRTEKTVARLQKIINRGEELTPKQQDAYEHGMKLLSTDPGHGVLDPVPTDDDDGPPDDDGRPPRDDDDGGDPDPADPEDPNEPYCGPGEYFSGPLGKCVSDDGGGDDDDGGGGIEDLEQAGRLGRAITPSGIGDIQGVSDIPRIYRKAGSMSAFLDAMGGMGFLANLAGVGIPVIAGGALAGFVAKRILGKTREGSFKNLAKEVDAPIDMSQIPNVPVQPISGEEAQSDLEAQAEKDKADAGGTDAAGGRGDVYVFRGKGGKGMQSQLAKGGIKGADMSALLKGLRADLSAAGFNVLEEGGRETIPLKNTIGAIEQMKDPAQKETAKRAVMLLLRKHKIVGNMEAQLALKPGGGEEEADIGAGRSQDVVDQDGNVIKKGVPLGGDEGGGDEKPDPPEINTQNRTPEKPHAPLVSYAKDVEPETGSEADKIQKAQADRAAKSNAAQQSRGASKVASNQSAQAARAAKSNAAQQSRTAPKPAEDKKEKKKKRGGTVPDEYEYPTMKMGGMKNEQASKVAGTLEEGLTLDRWKKLAGIIKG